MDKRRMSDGVGAGMQAPANRPGPTPAMQVVGFHVEGASPSPVMGSLLAGTATVVGAGSPTPVIIPPSFQVQQPAVSNVFPIKNHCYPIFLSQRQALPPKLIACSAWMRSCAGWAAAGHIAGARRSSWHCK